MQVPARRAKILNGIIADLIGKATRDKHLPAVWLRHFLVLLKIVDDHAETCTIEVILKKREQNDP